MTIRFRRALVALALPLAFALHSASAAADQCAWVDESAANAAVKILNEHHEVRLYCALCDDKSVKPFTVTKAEVAQATMRGKTHPYKVVRITNASGQSKEIDLAYAYVQLDPKSQVFTNLAKLASCPAEGVPETIGDKGPGDSGGKKK